MSVRRLPAQPRLPGTRRSRTQGTVERHANADLKQLRDLHAIAPGMSAIEDAYKRVAAELDAAFKDQDRYGVINTVRELRNTRAALAPGALHEGDDALERFIAQLPATPRGHAQEPRSA